MIALQNFHLKISTKSWKLFIKSTAISNTSFLMKYKTWNIGNCSSIVCLDKVYIFL